MKNKISLIFSIIFLTFKAWSQVEAPLYKFFQPNQIFNLNDTTTLNKLYIKPIKIDNLPFFCKMEEQLFKKTKLNFRFRIGDIDNVNYLERKD